MFETLALRIDKALELIFQWGTPLSFVYLGRHWHCLHYKMDQVFTLSRVIGVVAWSSLNGRLPVAAALLTQPLDAVLRILPNVDTSLFRKTDRYLGLALNAWTVQNLLNNTDTCLSLMQDCLPPLVDSTTGIIWYIFWLDLLTSIQQGRAQGHAFVVLNSMSMDLPCPLELYQKPPNRDTSLLRTL